MLNRLPSRRRADPETTGRAAAREDGAVDPRVAEQRLVARARAGDQDAVAELYALHHPVALGIARRSCRPSDVDDVVSEAFTKVLDLIARGGGPQVSFRAYLITAVRSASADLGRAQARLLPSDTVEELQHEASTAPDDQPHSTLRADSELLAEALSGLPPRWQLAIWWTTVEGRSLAEVGDELNLNANAVAALGFRARQALRDAYLALHVAQSSDRACGAVRGDFPAFARDRLAPARADAVLAHLLDCQPCREVIAELRSLLLLGAAR
ncbi:sigma-70 family RNA polymerase sigma factor [Nocardioides sp. 1609]|uniref:RNA polymerase sigma factor n=1 Tax=Nocardioides sp. 1609 TaxID=2508327 RepID=UPI00106FDE2C|nr:sigma-70 family RNA polymerase sigma factor [Nocardioides sp. 1609]